MFVLAPSTLVLGSSLFVLPFRVRSRHSANEQRQLPNGPNEQRQLPNGMNEQRQFQNEQR